MSGGFSRPARLRRRSLLIVLSCLEKGVRVMEKAWKRLEKGHFWKRGQSHFCLEKGSEGSGKGVSLLI
jgi:hypothetical protein